MSNLYKQWFVRTDVGNARVINSDAIMSEFMDREPKQAVQTEGMEAQGFSEGIAIGEMGNLIKAEPEVNYVQLAKEEAEQILEAARSQAEETIARAKAEKDEIQREARESGYQAGKAQLQEELDRCQTELESSYRMKLQTLETQYIEKREHMEEELVDVILKVFNKVFHIQFDNKKEILMYLIGNAILNIEGEKKFRIKVAESNAIFMENHKDEILDRVGHDIELELVTDSTMEGNDCIIETDSGVFDCSLGIQLENLIKDIRSLCA